jgi:hypothetical protein
MAPVAAQRDGNESARREFPAALDSDPKEVKSPLDLGIFYQNIGDRKSLCITYACFSIGRRSGSSRSRYRRSGRRSGNWSRSNGETRGFLNPADTHSCRASPLLAPMTLLARDPASAGLPPGVVEVAVVAAEQMTIQT